MITKHILTTFATLFAVLFLLTIVSASLTINVPSSLTAIHGTAVTNTVTINNTGTADYSSLTIQGNDITFSPGTFSLSAGQQKTITFSIDIPLYTNPISYDYDFDVKNGTTILASDTITIEVNETEALEITAIGTLTNFDNSTTFKLKNIGNVDLVSVDLSIDSITYDSDKEITFTYPATITNLEVEEQETITVSAEDIEDLPLGDYTTTITASSDDAIETGTLTVERSYCDVENNGNLEIKIKDINVDGFGDDTEWFPLDNIEVEIEVENKGNEKIKDIVVEWGLYNHDTKEFLIDDEEADFDLKDGKDKILTVTFKLDEDVDELGDGDYVFYVKATGEDQEIDDDICDGDFEPIEIVIESDFVILDDMQFPDVANCDSDVQITADVWNVGDDDQDDVYVVISNKELGINKEVIIGDINSLDSEKLDTIINIPQDAEEKTYFIKLTVYDDNDDVYENDFDDDLSEFFISLKVEGNCLIVSDVQITAELISDAIAGQETTIRATIKNTGDEIASYTITLSGYESWATLNKLEPSSLSIGAGQSKDVLIYLTPNQDVDGEQIFSINAVYDGNLKEKEVRLFVTGTGAGITGFSIIENLQQNWFIWLIVVINIILIIAIILVARRIVSSD